MRKALLFFCGLTACVYASAGELTQKVTEYAQATEPKNAAHVLAKYWSRAALARFFEVLPAARDEFEAYVAFSDHLELNARTLETLDAEKGCVFFRSTLAPDFVMVDLVNEDKAWKIDRVTDVYSEEDLVSFDQCHGGTMKAVEEGLKETE